jgi:flagellar biosynthesis component FlhA
MEKIKLTVLRFLVSKSGSLLTPIIAGFVATLVAKVAAFDAQLAGQIDQSALVGFIVAAILAAVNYATNAAQTPGIKKIQALVNTDQDGIPGPITYTEVRRAIAVEK